jgi:hypothetical protein
MIVESARQTGMKPVVLLVEDHESSALVNRYGQSEPEKEEQQHRRQQNECVGDMDE